MKFLVDSTAGKLSRWLRVLGHDVLYLPSASPGEMIARARSEGRVLLSRNRSLSARDPSVTATLVDDDLAGQLRQVDRQFALLEGAVPFTRCVVCNGALERVPRRWARNRVPEYVYQTQKRFGYCGSCDRFYWKATHWWAMVERLRRVFGPEAVSGTADEGPGDSGNG